MNYEERAFIFDMDGTLVDNMRFHTEAWRTLIEENGFEFNERKFLVETAGQTNREIIPSVFGAVSNERLSELALRKEELYREVYIHHRKPVDGLVDFLETSHGLGIKLAVSTAASPPNMAFILDGLDLRKYFGAITTAADVKRGKPDPEIFLISAANVGVEPRNSIVFEDAFFGFEAAKRAGMKAIGITTVNSYDEIMQADGVVEAHADFKGIDPGEIVQKYTREREL
ncbi:MAG TPA: HAD family phosphatase [Pyrinomonadaceae bacterium]|nr:HAD family phosphatase [Pyrinomonadaceae bacterium]